QVSDPYFVISVDYEEAQTNDPAAAYAKALTDAGWTVTTEEDELGVIYFANDATGDLFVNFYYVDDYTWADLGYESHTMTIAIASWQAVLDNGYTLVDAWPSEQVASFVKDEGDTIPEIAGDGYAYALADKALCLRVEGATAEAYKSLLEGWTVTEEEGGFLAENDATDPSLRLYFYEEYGYLWIEAENILNGGEFDFSSTAQMTAQDGAKSVWADSKVTFTVEKGSSSQNVGNGSYFADPLRVYAGQVITIASTDGSPIESVEFETDGSSYASVLAKSTVSSGTLTADSWTVTWTPTEEVSSFTITLSAQVRFQSATVVLK
ncbi:MAG: hypothetical protein K6F32_00615, partial [Bacilli bacterium]|nr:hypothetical protein [Bacilli bacterium]